MAELGNPALGTITQRHPMAYHREIPYSEAKAHVIPFGRYGGRTIDDIAKTDRGLLWLDWLYHDRWDKRVGTTRTQSANERETNGCLHVYLNDVTIAKEVAAAHSKGKG